MGAARRLELDRSAAPADEQPAPSDLEARLEAALARIASLELAVTALDARLPRTPAGPTKTLFGVAVRLAPGVTDDRIRQELDRFPRGLAGDEVVDRLEELGLLARKKDRPR
jgi:hypothetical protein